MYNIALFNLSKKRKSAVWDQAVSQSLKSESNSCTIKFFASEGMNLETIFY